MKIGLTAIAAFAVLLAPPALAADMALKAPPAPVIPSWAGFYAGVQVGALWNRDALSETTAFLPPLTGSATTYGTSIIGGVHAGYNWQVGHVVFGPEADFEGTALKTTQTCLVQNAGVGNVSPGSCFASGLGYSVTTQIPWQASIRARIGYAWSDYLVYATGGAAFAELQNTYAQAVGAVGASQTFNDTVAGGTVGGGLEYRFMGHWIGRIEYRWSEFSGISDAITNAGTFWNGYTEHHNIQENAVRVGLSYLF